MSHTFKYKGFTFHADQEGKDIILRDLERLEDLEKSGLTEYEIRLKKFAWDNKQIIEKHFILLLGQYTEKYEDGQIKFAQPALLKFKEMSEFFESELKKRRCDKCKFWKNACDSLGICKFEEATSMYTGCDFYCAHWEGKE